MMGKMKNAVRQMKSFKGYMKKMPSPGPRGMGALSKRDVQMLKSRKK